MSDLYPQSSRVEELREGSEVAYQRRVAAVKGESLVGISDYRYGTITSSTCLCVCAAAVII